MERVLVVRLGWLRGGVGMRKLMRRSSQLSHDREALLQVAMVHFSWTILPRSQTLCYVYHIDLFLCTSTSLMLLRRLLLIHMSSSRAKRVVATACHRSD